jgi:hypothetical protein
MCPNAQPEGASGANISRKVEKHSTSGISIMQKKIKTIE